MWKFFNKIFSFRPEMEKVKGLYVNVHDIQASIRREQELLIEYGGELVTSYVKGYDGEPLPSQTPQWTGENKLKICQLFQKIKQCRREIFRYCDAIVQLLTQHTNAIK